MLQRGDDKERRSSLRRLDDILDALEQLNLHDRTELTESLAESLVLLGVDDPYGLPIPQLIEKVWAMQQPYLITIVFERLRPCIRSEDRRLARSLPAHRVARTRNGASTRRHGVGKGTAGDRRWRRPHHGARSRRGGRRLRGAGAARGKG